MHEAYSKLRIFLDLFPLGYPRTASGVEMEILKRLFTEEEASVATLLTPFPEEAGQIAQRAGMEEEYLKRMLEAMAAKGLIFRVRRGEKTFFNSAPFMIGLYEYSVKRIDKDLAGHFARYYEEAYQEEMGKSDIAGFKVIPLGVDTSPDMTLYPYPALEDEVRNARRISVAECICRKEAHLMESGCDRPMETCLSFGAAAEYYIENKMGREIDAEEAIAILKAADDAGLVHAGANTVHLSNICNCCPCCCASLKGITRKGMPRHKFLNVLYEASVNQDECEACGLCIERCPVAALSLQETASVDRGRCLGCGLCANACPTGAISMPVRPDRKEPFARVMDMGMAILEAKANKPASAPGGGSSPKNLTAL